GLLPGEQVQVPVPVIDPGPGRPSERAGPVVRGRVAVALAEDVPLAGGAVRPGRQRLLEPGVRVGGVVGHDIDHELEAAPVGFGQQPVEVGEAPEDRVHAPVVGHVVAAVGHRGRVERAQPDRVHAQVGQVVQSAGDAGEVTYPVAVGVGEAARVDLVDHGVGGPGFAYRQGVNLAAATACSKVAASPTGTAA